MLETLKKDSRVTCTGLFFTNKKALTKNIRWLKHTIRYHNGFCLWTEVDHDIKLVLIYYVAT